MARPRLRTWSKKYKKCRRCGASDKLRTPHWAHGLCASCYRAPYVRAWRARKKAEREAGKGK